MSGAQVLDREAVVVGQTGGDERAVAGLGVALDAEQRGEACGGQRRDEGGEVDAVEDLGGVATDVLGREYLALTPVDRRATRAFAIRPIRLGWKRSSPSCAPLETTRTAADCAR